MEENYHIQEEKQPLFFRVIKNKRILFFIIIPLGILVLFMLFSLIFRRTPQTNPNPITIPTPSTSPLQTQKLSVTTTTPQNNAQYVGTNTPITITFSRPLRLDEQQSVSLSLSPTVPGVTSFDTANTTITFTPTQKMKMNQTYSVTVQYSGQTNTFRFTTITEPSVSPDQLLQQQTEDDYDFGQKQKALYDEYPWYNKLPLMTDTYFVYFDTQQKKFFATAYVQTMDEDISSTQQQAVQQLQSQGIPYQNYPLEWTKEIKK